MKWPSMLTQLRNKVHKSSLSPVSAASTERLSEKQRRGNGFSWDTRVNIRGVQLKHPIHRYILWLVPAYHISNWKSPVLYLSFAEFSTTSYCNIHFTYWRTFPKHNDTFEVLETQTILCYVNSQAKLCQQYSCWNDKVMKWCLFYRPNSSWNEQFVSRTTQCNYLGCLYLSEQSTTQ
jgi:hypothetical protein